MTRASRVAEACAAESGANTLSDKAKDVALIAIACATPDKKAWRRKIKENYRKRHPECGSVFLIFVLPLLISLISNWLAKWIFKESLGDLDAMRAEALNALG